MTAELATPTLRGFWLRLPLMLWLARLVVALISFTVHELAHALAALALGDTTAREAGRLTLNPFRHTEWFGLLAGVFMGIGWSRPAPIRPHRMTVGERLGGLLAVLAGPLASLALMFGGLGLLNVLAPASGSPVGGLLRVLVRFNLMLALLNVLPLHPLDGYRAVRFLLPLRAAAGWERASGWTTAVLGASLALLVVLPDSVIAAHVVPLVNTVLRVLPGI